MANIEDRIKEIISDELGVDTGEITLNASLEMDLGADSLDAVELVMRFEEEFEIEIADEDAEKIKTVQNCVDLVMRITAMPKKGRERVPYLPSPLGDDEY